MSAPVAAAKNRVSNASVRKAFKDSGIAAAEVAMRIGWEHPSRPGVGNAGRLTRTLGITDTWRNGTGERYRQTTMSEENAAKILEAIGVDPVDVGL